MGTHEVRPGRRRWLALLAASCVLLLVACWQLGTAPMTPPPDADGWIVEPGHDVGAGLPAPSASTVPAAPADAGQRALWSSQPSRSRVGRMTSSAPRQLLIDRLGVSMPVMAKGLTSDGQMALPDHPQQIGWYRYGPRPGDPSGSVVLGGHVDSRAYGVGPLAALGRLERGDRIVVQQAHGKQAYRVQSVQLVAKRALPVAELFDRSGPAVLRILTCGGPYDRAHGGYRDNLVVTAVPL